MRRLLLNISERGKISYVPTKNPSIGRREPVTIQIVPAPLMQESSSIVNIIIHHNNRLIPCPTPNEFIPAVNTALKDRLSYIHAELAKIMEERREEEFSHFSFHSHISDDVEPQMKLTDELYLDRDVSLGESAIPYHLQQRELGSLNDRHPSNPHPHDTIREVVTDKSRPKMKGTYSRWSE